LAAEGQRVIRAALDVRSVAGQRDVGGTDFQRHLAVFIGQHEPHLAAADADSGDLPNGILVEIAGHAERHREVRRPGRLGAGCPGADPILGAGRLKGERHRGARQKRGH